MSVNPGTALYAGSGALPPFPRDTLRIGRSDGVVYSPTRHTVGERSVPRGAFIASNHASCLSGLLFNTAVNRVPGIGDTLPLQSLDFDDGPVPRNLKSDSYCGPFFPQVAAEQRVIAD